MRQGKGNHANDCRIGTALFKRTHTEPGNAGDGKGKIVISGMFKFRNIALGKFINSGHEYMCVFRFETVVVERVHDTFCFVSEWASGNDKQIRCTRKCCFF